MQTGQTRKHAAVPVCVGPWREDIDTAIAPLIREMWIAGIQTSMSCQGDGVGKVWIEFPELADLASFLNVVAKYEAGAETLYNRMNMLLRHAAPRDGWSYDLYPYDVSLIWPKANEPDGRFQHDGPPDFRFGCSVRFPVADLPLVFQRLRNHNRQIAARLKTAGIATASPPTRRRRGGTSRSRAHR